MSHPLRGENWDPEGMTDLWHGLGDTESSVRPARGRPSVSQGDLGV